MKRPLFLVLLFLVARCFAQNAGWFIDPYDDRYFIENIGQYDPVGGHPVVAGVENRGTEIFYTATGFTYRLRKPVEVPSYLVAAHSEEEPENEVEDKTRRVYETISIGAEWVGAQTAATVLGESQSPLNHFAKNGGQLVGAKSYGALNCMGLYDKIDLQYRFHESEGIKYNLTVHPGGDPGDIALQYSGMERLFLDSEGNVHATLGDAALIDHAPTAYIVETGESVAIQFKVNGDRVTFEVADYDHAKTLFIDPWLINPGFTTQGKVFDAGWDCSGNVVAFGGSGPWKVKKFNSAGVVQWTYNTAHIDWYGDMVSDDLGNIYITEGCCNGNRQKLNASGVVQWTVNNGVYEFWKLTLSCDYSRLTMATAYSASAVLTPAQSLSTVNLATGAVTGGTSISGSEPRAIAPSPAGNYYVVTSVGNEVIARTNAYGPIYTTSSGYSLLYNGPLYANGGNTTSGINGIAIFGTFIFTTNGATLMKRNLATGALISSVAIPGGTAEQYSGVAVDNCGNVFVGSNNAVYRYDINLAPVSTIAVVGAVYDVVVSGTSTVLIAGNNLLGSQTSPCVAPCNTCIILPVGLTDWSVNLNSSEQVDIRWTSDTPDADAQYTVERSADAVNFEALKSFRADRNTYDALDATPLKGYSWYRLAYQDAAGTTTYTQSKQVWNGMERSHITVYPNPVADELHVQLPPSATEGNLIVIDVQGKLVLQHEIEAEDLLEGETELHIANLPAGMYTLRIAGVQGEAVKFCKMDR